jgi:hypothetical protein
MINRVSYIANIDHVMGCVIVEIENNKTFHFRHTQFLQDGSMVDLGKKYYSDGQVDDVKSRLYMGDYHVGKTSPNVMKATEKLIKRANVLDIFTGDFFDGYSITDHDNGKLTTRSKKQTKNQLSLEEEGKLGSSEISKLLKLIEGKLYKIKGNHDERIDRYVESGRYVYEPINYYIGHVLAIQKHKGEDLAKSLYELNLTDDEKNRIVWFTRKTQFKIAGIELSQHGDKGMNGAKASIDSLEKAFGQCVVGHTHSACIMRGVYRVGTSTDYNLDYNDGQGNWSQTHCLIYDCGTRQLINIVKDRAYME